MYKELVLPHRRLRRIGKCSSLETKAAIVCLYCVRALITFIFRQCVLQHANDIAHIHTRRFVPRIFPTSPKCCSSAYTPFGWMAINARRKLIPFTLACAHTQRHAFDANEGWLNRMRAKDNSLTSLRRDRATRCRLNWLCSLCTWQAAIKYWFFCISIANFIQSSHRTTPNATNNNDLMSETSTIPSWLQSLGWDRERMAKFEWVFFFLPSFASRSNAAENYITRRHSLHNFAYFEIGNYFFPLSLWDWILFFVVDAPPVCVCAHSKCVGSSLSIGIRGTTQTAKWMRSEIVPLAQRDAEDSDVYSFIINLSQRSTFSRR